MEGKNHLDLNVELMQEFQEISNYILELFKTGILSVEELIAFGNHMTKLLVCEIRGITSPRFSDTVSMIKDILNRTLEHKKNLSETGNF